MKRKALKTIVLLFILIVASCNEPETIVTNIVHPDGSVTRKIEIRNTKNEFSTKSMRVPCDSTWKIRDSLEISKKGDTTWVKRAEKLFASVDELNAAYKSDSGKNKGIVRNTEFRKQFKWFTTDYTFSENIDRKLKFGYPVSAYLNKEELNYFYSPGKLIEQQLKGPDSLKFKAIVDTLGKKTDKWVTKSLMSELIAEFDLLTPGRTEKELSRVTLKSREDELVSSAEKYTEHFDSLWNNGFILKDLFGEAIARKYKSQFDSAMKIVENRGLVDFGEYSVRILMPGKLTGTNGFMDSSRILLWPVKSDYFFTEPYRMWAESKTTNAWAWIVTGLFLSFVAAGLVIRRIRN